jgi:putative DNA primase/helicase
VYANGDIPEKSNELQMILDKYMLRPTPVKQLVDDLPPKTGPKNKW